jgi:glucose-6-phosphate dehydrogenase assembly protein OpcA
VAVVVNGHSPNNGQAVDVTAIERALADLWTEEERAGETSGVLTRACMSNLIVFCSGPEEAAAVTEDLGGIVEQHPARVLLLTAGAGGDNPAIEAYVSAQCHLVGGGKQVCSEQVRLSAGAADVARLPSVVRALLMADLPTALWWVPPAAPPLAGAVFDDLAGMAGQVIYDSGAWQEAETGVMAVVAWLGRRRECRLADLGWRRLKPWRRVIAETVDPLLLPGALSSLRTVTVDYAGATALQAYLLIGWLASRLDWQCVRGLSGAAAEAACTFATASGSVRVLARRLEDREPGLQRVALAWEEARQARSATVAWHGHDRLLVNVEGDAAAARVLPVQRKPRAALVARQLADLHGDAVFLDSLQVVRSVISTRASG